MLKLRDIMARDVIVVEPDTTLRDVIAVLIERRITGVPVVARGRVTGVVSASDLLDAVALSTYAGEAERKPWNGVPEEEAWVEDDAEPHFFTRPWEEPGDELERFGEVVEEHDVLDERTAAEVMTRALHTLPSHTPLDEAARYMLETGIHRVLVLDNGELAGVATTTDFMRAIAEHRA